MSVRNHYARNYYKIVPLPQTSAEIEKARIATRRRNEFSYQKDDKFSTSNNAISIAGTKVKGKLDDDVTGTRDSKHPHDVFAAHVLVPQKGHSVIINGNSDVSKARASIFKTKVRHQSLGDTDKTLKSHVKNFKDKGASPPRRYSDDDVTDDVTISRPLSARPESRWQRRNPDEEFDDAAFEDIVDDKEELIKYNHKLTRQDSKTNTQQAYFDLEAAQHRPKTSHGRKPSSSNSNKAPNQKVTDSMIQTQRPGSRKGNFRKNSNSYEVNKPTKVSRHHQKKSSVDMDKDSVPINDMDYNIGIATFYPEMVDKIKGLDDIKLQIEDIDLNVDPVLFFMSDTNKNPGNSDKKRASLSKDALNLITNEKSSRNLKQPIGFQGNNQNKQSSVPEKIDRFHGNQVLSLQNTIADSNHQHFNANERQDRIRSNSFQGDNDQSIEIGHRMSRLQNTHIEKVSPPYRLLNSRDSTPKLHAFNNEIKALLPKPNGAYNRKPRRLKPLTSSYVEE